MSEEADKKTETYQLDELSKKEEEANEDTPLKPKDNDVEAGQTDISETKENEKAVMASADEKSAEDKQSMTLLDQKKVKLILAIVGAVLLVLLLLIVAILVIIYRDGWEEDKTYRYLRLVPKPNGPQNLLQFRHGLLPYEGQVWPDLVKEIDEFLLNYRPDVKYTRNVTDCYPGGQRAKGTSCFFDINTISPLCLKDDYGYPKGMPCLYLQFNNISDWEPEEYTDEDFEANPDLPIGLRSIRTKFAYIECKGNTIVDQENMGPIEYMPTQGFAGHFFPYDGHRDYMPPFVAIRFRAAVTSMAIGITCRLYSKNLNQTDDTTEPVASLPFNLFIE